MPPALLNVHGKMAVYSADGSILSLTNEETYTEILGRVIIRLK